MNRRGGVTVSFMGPDLALGGWFHPRERWGYACYSISRRAKVKGQGDRPLFWGRIVRAPELVPRQGPRAFLPHRLVASDRATEPRSRSFPIGERRPCLRFARSLPSTSAPRADGVSSACSTAIGS